MSFLSENELIAAERDFPAWLLDEDIVYTADFCDGAKETHSLPAVEGFSGSELILPGYNEELPLEEVFKSEILPEPEQQHEEDLYNKHLEEISHLQAEEQRKHDEIFRLRQKEEQDFARKQSLLNLEKQKQLESVDQALPKLKLSQSLEFDISEDQFMSPELPDNIFEDSSTVLPTSSNGCSPTYHHASDWQSLLNSPQEITSIANSPYIITVPLSEASPSPVPSQTIEAYFTEEPEQQVVINIDQLRTRSPDIPSSPQGAALTLKEALSNEEADDFLENLLHPKPVECVEVISNGFEVQNRSVDTTPVCETDEMFNYEIKEEYSPVSDHDVETIQVSDFTAPPKRKGIRGNPYALTERRLRKKEQNKRAALKYRMKKKDEETAIASEVEALELRNQELQKKFEATRSELQVMQELAKSMLAARGMLKI